MFSKQILPNFCFGVLSFTDWSDRVTIVAVFQLAATLAMESQMSDLVDISEKPDSPLTTEKEGHSIRDRPNGKITVIADIPSLKVRKGIRLLPTQTLDSFIVKLQKKKIIGNIGVGGVTVMHKRDGDSRQLWVDSERTLWDLGVRDEVRILKGFVLFMS